MMPFTGEQMRCVTCGREQSYPVGGSCAYCGPPRAATTTEIVHSAQYHFSQTVVTEPHYVRGKKL